LEPTSIPLTSLERAADELVEQGIAERLPRARKLAEQWGTTATALTALFGTGTVLGADDAVRALALPWSGVYGLLVGLALLCAAGSIVLAASGAQQQVVDAPEDLTARVKLVDALTDSVLKRLLYSKWASGLAIVFLMASFAVRWFGPVSASASAGAT
jgi:hypothetical protein